MKNYSLILPTRGHVKLVERLFNSLIGTTHSLDRLEVVLYVDEDDIESQRIQHSLFSITKIVGPRTTMGNIMRTCFEASKGRYVILMNDDVIFRTRDWDVKALETFARFPDEVALVYGNDLYYGKKLATFPIISRTACEMMGKICPAEYKSQRIDSHIFDVFKRLSQHGHNRVVYLSDVVFEHMYFEVGASVNNIDGFTKRDSEDQSLYLSLSEERENIAKALGEHIESWKRETSGKIQKSVPGSASLGKPEKFTTESNSGSSQPKVSVVVSVYDDSLRGVFRCLDILEKQSRAEGIPVDIILIADQAAARLSSYPKNMRSKIKIIQDPTRSRASSYNKASSIAGGDYIAFLTDSAIPQAGWLRSIANAMEDKTIGVVGSKCIDSRNGRVESAGISFFKDAGAQGKTCIYKGLSSDHPAVCKRRELQAVETLGMVVRKDDFLKAKGFDSALGGLKDIDICLKIRKSGKRIIVVPEAVIHCEARWQAIEAEHIKDLDDLSQKWGGIIEDDLSGLLSEDGLSLRSDGENYYVCQQETRLEELISNIESIK